MMHQKGSLWLNHQELDKKSYSKIKDALLGEGKLFDLWDINTSEIPSVQQFRWKLEGNDYEKLMNTSGSMYETSPSFVYFVESDFIIPFHLRCYNKYTENSPQCAIFVEVEEFPQSIRKLRIEADIKATLYKKCGGTKKVTKVHRQLMKTQILSRDKNVCGFQLFDHEQLTRNTSLEWMIGVKIVRAEEFQYDEREEYLKDLYQIFE